MKPMLIQVWDNLPVGTRFQFNPSSSLSRWNYDTYTKSSAVHYSPDGLPEVQHDVWGVRTFEVIILDEPEGAIMTNETFPEPTHKIINKHTGLEILGQYKGTTCGSLEFWIHGATVKNLFEITDWTLEELPKPLPTKPGMYVEGGADLEHAPDIYYLNTEGDWYSDFGGLWNIVGHDDLPRNLVRLVKEDD